MFRRKTLVVALAAALAPAAHAQVLEEVIVTAQKRSEDVLDVPISITAFSGAALERVGATSLTDVGRFTAGVDMNNENVLQPEYNVRGIETVDWTIGSDPAVAVYVDGVYTARGAGAEAALVDIERVEILKGPQGTLFGRNATGGAIHIITPKPSDELEGRIRVTAGNYSRTDAEVVLNAPFSDSFAVRLVGAMRQRDGFIDDVRGGEAANDEDRMNWRLSALWNAGDATEVLLRAGYEDIDQRSGVSVTLNPAVFTDPQWGSAGAGANPPTVPVPFADPALAFAGRSHDPFGDGAWDGDQREAREATSLSLEITHDFDGMTFTSISAWRDVTTKLDEDLDGSDNPDYFFAAKNPEWSEYWSQELRLTGETDAMKWTLGATYSYEDIRHDIIAEFLFSTFESFALQSGGVPAEQLPTVRALQRQGLILHPTLGPVPCGLASCDGFAIASFIDQLTGGAFGGAANLLPFVQPRLDPTNLYAFPWVETVNNAGEYESYAIYGDATWSLSDRLNLSAGLRYTYDDKTFDLFTAWTNELLPGVPFGLAFYNQGQPVLDERQSESWDNLSGRLVLDYALSDSVMGYASVATGFKSGGFNSQNYADNIDTSFDAEEVINYELGIKGRTTDGRGQFNIAGFFYEYEDLQTLTLIGEPIPGYYLRTADAEGYGFEVETAWMLGEHLTLAGNYGYLKTEFTDYNIIEAAGETPADDLTGEPRAETPEHMFNVSLEYQAPLGDLGEVLARLDYTWTDNRLTLTTRGDVPSYDLINARLGWLSNDGHWDISIWGRNLTDEQVLITFGGNGDSVGSRDGWWLTPRMYGLDLAYLF